MRRIAIVGASLAGVNAAESLRDNGYDGSITLIDAEPHLPVDRPPLSKDLLRDEIKADDLLLRNIGWYDELGIDVVLGAIARGIDVNNREVVLAGDERINYDGLVLATGSTVRTLTGLTSSGSIHRLRTLADAEALRCELVPGRHLVVVGAGFIGLEAAAAATRLGLDVSVVETGPAPLTRVVGEEAGRWFRSLHAAHGVTIHCATAVQHIDVATGGTKVTLQDGTVLHADVVVAGVGVSPATDWLKGSCFALGDGVLCAPSLGTNVPGVVAAGDIVRWHHPIFHESVRIEQWTNAAKQGQHAARTLLGETEAFAEVPYFWSEQFDARILSAGLAAGADQTFVKRSDAEVLTVLYGRNGFVRGAVCVNAPRELARYRQAIRERTPWAELAVD